MLYWLIEDARAFSIAFSSALLVVVAPVIVSTIKDCFSITRLRTLEASLAWEV